MNTLTFDKLRFINTLKVNNKFDDAQAEQLANAIDDALKETVATKYDVKYEIDILRRDLKIFFLAGQIGLFLGMAALLKFF